MTDRSLYDSFYQQQLQQHGNPMQQHGNPMQQHGNPMQQHGNPMQQHGNPMQSYPSHPNAPLPFNPTHGFQQQQYVPPPVYYPPPSSPQYNAPTQFTAAPSTPSDVDYYKGFYEGVVRNSGPQVGSLISWVAPVAVNLIFFLGPIVYIRRKYAQQMGSAAGGAAAAKSNPLMEMMMPMKNKNFRVDVKGTKFSDVIGIPEAKEDLKQYVDFLKDPAKFTRLGARLPKGCLMTGQPGTGKTLLARAVAGEASSPFFTCSGADFIEVFGGSGPKRVRELFQEARAAAPCVVFIDEIDAIGSRSSGRSMGGGGSSEENRTINQLLAELDGLSSKEAIVVIAATNFPEAIDKALLREGRFDRKVNIPMPDKAAREELFQFYLTRIITGDATCKPKIMKLKERPANDGEIPKPTVVDKIVETAIPVPTVVGICNKALSTILADRTPGVSPAQIATIVNEAALSAAVKEEQVVTLPYLQEGIDDVLIGKRHRQRMSDASLRRTAFHECGHAIMAWLSPLQKDVIKISIIPRGRAGGYTQQTQDEAMEPQTDQFLFSQLCVLLGGRVAERIIMGDISTGALDDLQRATKIAMDKLLHFGMSQEIGQLAFKENSRQDGRAWMNYSEDLHSRVEAEARALVQKAYNHTEETLRSKSALLTQLAEQLLNKKELVKDDIISVLGQRVAVK